MQGSGARKRKRTLLVSFAVAVIGALAVGISGTARSESAPWPGGRVAALWPTFAEVPQHANAPWNGSFRRCVRSTRVQLDFRCEYGDAAGRVGYVCVAAGDARRDLSRRSVTAVVAPADPTYAAASPSQVCFASLAYAMSLG